MSGGGLRSLLVLVGLTLASCAAAPPHLAKPPREVHGMAEAFAAPGVAIAWGVLRAANDAEVLVVMRIVTHRAAYPWFAVVGSDPFTQSKQQVFPATRGADITDVRVPRAHFAEFPRTEVRFYESAAAARQDNAALVVFFLGVPDTTPEFATEARLEAYLGERVVRALNPSE